MSAARTTSGVTYERCRRAAGLVLVVLVATAKAHAQTDDAAVSRSGPELDGMGLPVAAPPAYTGEQARAWRDEMMPVVAEIAGRAFVGPPPIRLVSRQELVESMTADRLAQLEAIDPGFDRGKAELTLALDFIAPASTLLARYSITEDAVLLPAGNARPLLQLLAIDDEHLVPIMKLVVAHELAHALNAQHIDVLGQTGALRTSDEARAHNATHEGFAMLVQEAVADATGAGPANTRLVDLMSLRSVDDERLESARRRYELIYEAGWRFLAARLEAGGWDAVWATLEYPPVTFAQVKSPETYGQAVEMRLEPARLFRDVRNVIREGAWNETLVSLDADQAAGLYAALGTEATDDIRSRIDTVHSLILVDRTPQVPEVRNVAAFTLNEASDGAPMVEHLVRFGDTRFGPAIEAFTSGGAEVEQSTTAAIGDLEADHAHLYRVTVREAQVPSAPPASTELTFAVAVRDTVLVQVTGTGSRVDDASLATIIASVLERSADNSALVPVPPVDTDDPLVVALGATEPYLVDGDWTAELREVTRAAIEQLIGADVRGQAVLQSGFAAGHACHREGPPGENGSTRSVTITLIEMTSRDSAFAFIQPLTNASRRTIARFTQVPGATVEQSDETRAIVADGADLRTFDATILLPGRAPAVATVSVVQRGPFIAQIIDTSGALKPGQLEPMVAAMFDGVAR